MAQCRGQPPQLGGEGHPIAHAQDGDDVDYVRFGIFPGVPCGRSVDECLEIIWVTMQEQVGVHQDGLLAPVGGQPVPHVLQVVFRSLCSLGGLVGSAIAPRPGRLCGLPTRQLNQRIEDAVAGIGDGLEFRVFRLDDRHVLQNSPSR